MLNKYKQIIEIVNLSSVVGRVLCVARSSSRSTEGKSRECLGPRRPNVFTGDSFWNSILAHLDSRPPPYYQNEGFLFLPVQCTKKWPPFRGRPFQNTTAYVVRRRSTANVVRAWEAPSGVPLHEVHSRGRKVAFGRVRNAKQRWRHLGSNSL